ncbi:hypothetical protein Salmuc_01760 [Salipiger mucosus DSM 16094]|uniref:L,D-TPase catalytic domain-containing protein n=1 Tax=Salipiger mucosus DSM 16094 TaxID=1123237 RepID=S9S196_9RHOB|nr:hypothetical protein Salmuc_01760 [Salipiger mucosus DSM 16094]
MISEFISKARPMVDACSRAASAIDLSVDQLGDLAFRDTGKFVLVNIAAGSLVAYENGIPVMEMDAIVGKPEHETPEFDTEITSVRLNPTWTVPWSIVREEDWLERLETDPDFFRRNRFEIRDGDGDLMSLDEAAADPHRVRKFIQAPGRYNALGKFRFNIGSSQAIYLHDTRNRENFYDGSPITLSHGCVRIEKPLSFAAWLLERSESEITAMTRDGWTRDISLGTDVPIIMDYFTAWPNSAGELMIYDDIYDKEKPACRRPEEKS